MLLVKVFFGWKEKAFATESAENFVLVFFTRSPSFAPVFSEEPEVCEDAVEVEPEPVDSEILASLDTGDCVP